MMTMAMTTMTTMTMMTTTTTTTVTTTTTTTTTTTATTTTTTTVKHYKSNQHKIRLYNVCSEFPFLIYITKLWNFHNSVHWKWRISCIHP